MEEDTVKKWYDTKQDEVWREKNVSELEQNWESQREHELLMETVAKLVIGESILDAGCGIGHLCEFIPNNIKYTGVDQSIDMLKRAREKHPEATFIQQNFYNIDLPMFDTVVCLDVLGHQPDLEPAFSNLMKLSKKCFIVTLWINGRDAVRPRQYIGSRGEFSTWYTEEKLQEKFSGLNYEVHKSIGYKYKDIYRFFISADK